MVKLAAIVSVCALLPSLSVSRQNQVGQWKSYTDLKSVRSVVVSASRITAVTGGGIFVYDRDAGTYTRWTNSENLSTNDLTALAVDGNNRLWIGSSNGAVDVFDPATNVWRSIQDIANSSRPQKAITSFFGAGDSMLIASDFGVSVFIVSGWEFGDTYADFGFPSQPTVSGVVVNKNRIFVGTDHGVAGASLTSSNLSSPTAWTVYGQAQGLSSLITTALAVFHDTLLVGTTNGICALIGASFQQLSSTNLKYITGIVSGQNTFTYLRLTAYGQPGFVVESQNQVLGPSSLVASNGVVNWPTALSVDEQSSNIAVASNGQGVWEWNGSQWNQRVPNGPQSNLFISMCVDDRGILWAGSGIGGSGKGFYRFNPSFADSIRWKNFTAAQYPVLNTDDYYKTSTGMGGSVWISSWGDGVVEMTGDTIRRRLSTVSMPSFAATVPQTPTFVVVGGVAVDPDGKTWFVDRTAVNGNFLNKLVNDTTFQYYRNLYNPGDGFLSSMVIDENGTRWFANSEPTQKASNGLYYFNDNLSVAGTAAYGGWGNISVADGLPNNTILSLAVDVDNTIWVGTDLGVMILTNALNPRSNNMSSFPLREQSIQAIAVDALNNKWIGTKQGVFVVNSDGTQLLNQYTVLNTNGKLVDDDVRAIAIDQRRGVVYLGTQKGLSSLQIAPVQAVRSYTTLQLGPNPYTLPNAGQLVISNLVSNSTIKILAVDGTLIAEFAAQGAGRAFWDGRDQHGKLVPSGIYYVLAYAENGNQVATGKVAVVRK